MVAYVYKRKFLKEYKYPEEVMKLSGINDGCKVSDYYDGEGDTYKCELSIGGKNEFILLRGIVVHDLVKSVMRGSSKKTREMMVQYLQDMIQDDSDNRDTR